MKLMVITVLMTGLALPALAFLGLPIAEDATSEAGLMRASGGITLESDVNLYGGRFTYGVSEDLSVFGGGGLIDVDGADTEPFLQLGAKFRLPAYDLPVDLAVRGAFGITSFDESAREGPYSINVEVDLWTLNVGLLASKQFLDPQLTGYGLLGISYQNMKVKGTISGPGYRESASDSDNETELAIAAGAIYELNDQLSFYGELAHIDELFVSLGARFQF